jgi:HSP20 family protein
MLWDTDVFNEMERLRRGMNNLFSGYGQAVGTATFPLMNVYASKDNIIVTAELPGITRDQVKITVADGVLTLTGETKPPVKTKGMAVIRQERSEGEFEKTFRIPTKVKQDAITASFVDGILTITLPKAEEAKPKNITIEAK